jgi:hypothetical protein
MSIDKEIEAIITRAIQPLVEELAAIKQILSNEKIYTLQQAAEHLKMNPQALRRECEKGRCKFFIAGKNRYRITHSALEVYKNNNQ